ncbi:MAG: aromatic-ring-hydroxylating dioxygenase subunit beta [Actinomycetota bacterium]|jgi:3-phenylpropionate/cinnamic acid dioxygenase small subunit
MLAEQRISGQVREEIEAFLMEEAELLDDGRLREWLELCTDDIRYEVPVRVTRERVSGRGITRDMAHWSDDWTALEMRVLRQETEYAWAEDPPSRTRHFVTNVRLNPGEGDDEIAVRSNVLLFRNRGDSPNHDLLSAERRDVVRRVDGRWKLARRRVILDHSTLPTHNLPIIF